MKRITILLIGIIITSCSANWHIKKAIKKDPSIQTEFVDSIQFTTTIVDTIYNSDSTYYIEHRTVSFDTTISYIKYDMSEVKGWFQSWQENKTDRTHARNDRRVQKTEAKQDGRTIRNQVRNDRKEANNGWKWFGIITSSLLLIVLLYFYLKRSGIIKKTPSTTPYP